MSNHMTCPTANLLKAEAIYTNGPRSNQYSIATKVAYVPLKPLSGWRAVDTRLPRHLADQDPE